MSTAYRKKICAKRRRSSQWVGISQRNTACSPRDTKKKMTLQESTRGLLFSLLETLIAKILFFLHSQSTIYNLSIICCFNRRLTNRVVFIISCRALFCSRNIRCFVVLRLGTDCAWFTFKPSHNIFWRKGLHWDKYRWIWWSNRSKPTYNTGYVSRNFPTQPLPLPILFDCAIPTSSVVPLVIVPVVQSTSCFVSYPQYSVLRFFSSFLFAEASPGFVTNLSCTLNLLPDTIFKNNKR